MFSDNKCSIDSNLAIIYAGTDVNLTETVDVIKVKTGNSVTHSVLNIRSVVEFFREGVTLYNSGDIYVLTDIGSKVKRHIQNTLLVKQIKIANNEDLSNTYTNFVAFHDQTGQVRMLPRNLDTGFAFEHVQEIIKRSSANSIVVVSLNDIFLLARKPQEHRQVSLARNKSNVKAGHKKVSLAIDPFVVKPVDRTDFLKQPISHPSDDSSETLNRQQSIVQEVTTTEIVEHNLVLHGTELYFNHQPIQQYDTRENGSVQQDNMSLYSRHSFIPRGNTYTPRQNQISSASRTSVDLESYQLRQQPGLTSQNSLVTSRSTLSSNDRPRNASSNTPIVPPRYPDYVDNDVRLASFGRWIRRNPYPSQLANAGFFFTKQTDLVRCFQCGIGLKDFSEGDDPLLEHVRHSGQCPFLPKVLGYEQLNYLKAQLEATDPDYNRLTQWNGGQGNFPSRSYRHPEYRSLEARLATFTKWPSNMTQRPAQLAEAGLYYTGEEDLVRCFACDGGLRRWDPADDPWTEHCRWFPTCPYCIEQKGEEYIALVQASVDQQYGKVKSTTYEGV